MTMIKEMGFFQVPQPKSRYEHTFASSQLPLSIIVLSSSESKVLLFALPRFSIAPFSPSPTSSSALISQFTSVHYRFPYNPITAPSWTSTLLSQVSMSSLSRISMPWFTISFQNFRLFYSLGFSATGKVAIIRLNIVCNGSTLSDASRYGTFDISAGILEASTIPSSTAYPRRNNSALFNIKVSSPDNLLTFLLSDGS